MATLPAVDPLATPGASILVAVAGLAGVALLGAGLAPAAGGSRIDGVAVGVALAIGVPVAAVTSAIIGTFMAEGAVHGLDQGADLAGQVLRTGVSDATRLAPLIAVASTFWVVVVRRWGSGAVAGATERP